MIDVMKRLAELDSKNPTMVKENLQVEECGMMPEMGMGMPMEKPSMPASINMTAGSGDELSDMLATIMQLAGRKAPGAEEPMGAEPALALTAEPEMGAGDPTSDMRSMIDKLNPMDGDDVSSSHGDIDNDGDHDMDDHKAEKGEEETDEGQYATSPSPETTGYGSMTPTGNDMHSKGGEAPKVNGGGNPLQRTMEQQLMREYKAFISETN